MRGHHGLPVLNLIPAFFCLQHLGLWSIIRVEESLWDNIAVPRTLTAVSIRRCKLSGKFLKLILGNKKLCEVDIAGTQPFSNEHLLLISARTSLTNLQLERLGNRKSGFDLSCIGSLDKLEELFLGGLSIKNENLQQMWSNFHNLKTLTLYELNISDEGFCGINHLQSLEYFCMTGCGDVSGPCFVSNISPISALKELWFDHLPFCNIPDGEEDMDVVICPLNEMASLKEIHLESDKRPGIMHSLCRCNQESWIVHVNYANCYTFKRP